MKWRIEKIEKFEWWRVNDVEKSEKWMMLGNRKRDRSYGMGSTCWDFEYFRFVRRFFFGWVLRDMRRLGKKFWRRIWMTGKEFKCFGLFDFSGLCWFCFSGNYAWMLRVCLGWWRVTWEDVIWKGTIYLQDWIRGSRHVGSVGHRRVKVGENIRGISKCICAFVVRSRSIRVFERGRKYYEL